MIRSVTVEIGARREDKEQTRRLCKLVVNGVSRGRLSLTFKEATHLQFILDKSTALVKETLTTP